MSEPMIEPVLAQVNIRPGNVMFYLVMFMIFGMPILRALFGQKKPTRPRRGPGKPGGAARGPGAGRAQAGRSAGGTAGAGGGLTMAERIARARQAQQGGAAPSRPAPARAQRPSPPPTRPTPSARPPARSSSPRPAAQHGPSAADRAARVQKAAQARQRQQREALARRQREQVLDQQRRQRELIEQRQRRAAAQPADHYREEHATHRLVADAIGDNDVLADGEIGGGDGHAAATSRRRGGAHAVLNGSNLREAFILKEVLDRPLTLRDAPGR